MPCLVRKRSDSPAGTERPNLQVATGRVTRCQWNQVFFSRSKRSKLWHIVAHCGTLWHHGCHRNLSSSVNFILQASNSWAIPTTSSPIESLSQSSGSFKPACRQMALWVTKRPLRTEEPYSFSCSQPSDPAASPDAAPQAF